MVRARGLRSRNRPDQGPRRIPLPVTKVENKFSKSIFLIINILAAGFLSSHPQPAQAVCYFLNRKSQSHLSCTDR